MYVTLNENKDKVIRLKGSVPVSANSLIDGKLNSRIRELSDSDLIEYGFYKVTEMKPSFDSDYESLITPSFQDFVISGNTVTVTLSIATKYSLTDYQLIKREELKKLRDTKLSSYTDGTNTFQTRQEDLIRISGVHTFLSNVANDVPAGFSWTDINNNEITMTKAEFIIFAEGVHNAQQTTFAVYKTHWTNILALTTHVDVKNYDITVNW